MPSPTNGRHQPSAGGYAYAWRPNNTLSALIDLSKSWVTNVVSLDEGIYTIGRLGGPRRIPREQVLTVASEIMAILCLALGM